MKKDIRCYAYWSNIGKEKFRTGTLLVGKSNETVVGNCVMKNPGSSNPISHTLRDDHRLVFTVDATIQTKNGLSSYFCSADSDNTVLLILLLSDLLNLIAKSVQ